MLLLGARLLCETFYALDLKTFEVTSVDCVAVRIIRCADVGLSRGRRSKVTKYGNKF